VQSEGQEVEMILGREVLGHRFRFGDERIWIAAGGMENEN
jgi:hypothetical protein